MLIATGFCLEINSNGVQILLRDVMPAVAASYSTIMGTLGYVYQSISIFCGLGFDGQVRPAV